MPLILELCGLLKVNQERGILWQSVRFMEVRNNNAVLLNKE